LSARTLDLLDRDDFAAIVGAAGDAGMVRFFDLLALRADPDAGGFQVFMRTPFVSAGLGCFVFWISHVSIVLLLFIE
jgi:hypothetical protein